MIDSEAAEASDGDGSDGNGDGDGYQECGGEDPEDYDAFQASMLAEQVLGLQNTGSVHFGDLVILKVGPAAVKDGLAAVQSKFVAISSRLATCVDSLTAAAGTMTSMVAPPPPPPPQRGRCGRYAC